jgi:multicomponent Na+:H+ antiporter subunit D
MMLLALPLFLLASWRVDLYREDVENIVFLGQATLFLAAGMSIWLAAVPLHGWMTAIGAEAPSVAAALVLTGFPLLALVTYLQVATEATWFIRQEQAGQLLLIAGLVSTVVGGLLASAQRSLRPLMGYAALFNMGCLLVGLAIGRDGGALAFYAGLATRALGLGLTGAATAAILQRAGGDTFIVLHGVAYRMPLATVALVLGGFTLAGLPLTAGFLPRWLLLEELAQADPLWIWLLVASAIGVAVGYLRSLNVMLSPPAKPVRVRNNGLSWLVTFFLVTLTLLSLWLSLFPDPLYVVVERLLSAYPVPPL